MSKLWEVDPETRSKLAIIQKKNGNDRCCDCGAPAPQWASPKFGTFICLNCAGIHRGLGVHISFVRSITMDAFKLAEIQRMEHAGNEPWKKFFDAHETTQAEGTTFEDATVKERYSGDVGEEWKARVTAKVEGREYVPGEEKKAATKSEVTSPGPGTPSAVGSAGSRSGTPGGIGTGFGKSKKEQNEDYFARMGGENASRSETLPPSQGGKFTGLGGGMPTTPPGGSQPSSGGGVPGIDDFQKDPVAALTKGFGWFTTTVGKSAKTVNDSYLQPAAKQFAESDFAAQARLAAAEVARGAQTGARGATDSFNRFVEGPDGSQSSRSGARIEPERKDFWDSFAALGEERSRAQNNGAGSGPRSGAIGTGAVKKGDSSGTGAGVKGKDDWNDNW